MIDLKTTKNRKYLLLFMALLFLWSAPGVILKLAPRIVITSSLFRTAFLWVAPEKFAIQLSKAGAFPLLMVPTLPVASMPGIECGDREEGVMWYGRSDDFVARYNRLVVSLPQFPGKCRVAVKYEIAYRGYGEIPIDSYIGNKIYLSDLNMTEEEYLAQRLSIETSSIFMASYFGHLDTVKEHVADINTCDAHGNGFPPIYYAEKGGHQEVVDFLKEHGSKEYKGGDCFDARPAGAYAAP